MPPLWLPGAAKLVADLFGQFCDREDEIYREAIRLEKLRGGSEADIHRTAKRLRRERRARDHAEFVKQRQLDAEGKGYKPLIENKWFWIGLGALLLVMMSLK